MKNHFFTFCMALLASLTVSSCSDNSEPGPMPVPGFIPPFSPGAFILYQGDYYNKVEGKLDFINIIGDMNLTSGVFSSANNRNLGSTPQCGICYGSKIYLGMYESNTIEILDHATMKSIRQIKLENSANGQNPRSMVTNKGKVYISMYNGYVARLDTASLEIDASVKVGPNPEVMAIYNNYLYVPNSGGMNYPDYNNTASVISFEPFAVQRTIEVPLNPARFLANKDGLYLISWGNYADIESALYKIRYNQQPTKICNARYAAVNDSHIFAIDYPWGGTPTYYSCFTQTLAVKTFELPEIEAPTGIGFADGVLVVTSNKCEDGAPNALVPGYVGVYNVPEYEHQPVFIKKFNGGIGETCIFSSIENY